jgi:HAD superfamily hydrolase (TIGR01509 family)
MNRDAEKSGMVRMNEIDCFLFDLGGVLVGWEGVVPLVDLTNGRLSLEQARRFWLESAWVRKFEAGQCSPEDYAEGVVAELDLRIEPATFLAAFYSWDKGPFTGAIELVLALKKCYQVACLSNNNVLHWSNPVLQSLTAHFDLCIASFQVGLMKPDQEIFDLAIRRIGKPAHRIVYFDDNPECVEAAQEAGLRAYQAKGVDAVRAHLARLSK